ncbi:hypothetical protein [[Mycoplasma] anseris]|uniref:Bacteriocin n=1 Tax=[Mycoplasma] anseris TaxID=92400 RepID=A0A2Z4NCK4_9BACT|nr:hypothetical protein [[Mycoplasma] anseris]AWX69289.1 hypothetical protein DP065_00760 [[Mycoplasma] anseris]
MEGFEKLNEQELNEYEGGFAISSVISAIISFIPTGISIASSIAGLVKSVNSPKGEIKTKDLNFKWDSSQPNIEFSTMLHYCN